MKKAQGEMALILRKDVYQSNPMIQARKDFGVIGMRVFFLGLRGINPHFSENDKYFDEDFKRLFIPTSKLIELFGGNTKYLSELRKACTKLFEAIVELNYADGGFKLMHMFDELEYKPKEGLYLQFSRKMRPYILDLFQSRGYTRINVEYLFNLSSPYAVRLLELLLQYQNIKEFKDLKEIKRTLTVEELRFTLNVPEGAYSDRMNNFRKYVLDDPIKEINNRTPYFVCYESVKEERKVVAFKFTMDTSKVPMEALNGYKTDSTNEAIEFLRSLGFAERDAKAIFRKCADVPDCFSRVNRAQGLLDRQRKPVKNKLGFLRKAIEEDWQVGGQFVRDWEREKSIETTKERKNAKKRRYAHSEERICSPMTPIGDVLKPMFSKPTEELTPAKPQQISIGKSKMSCSLAEALTRAIRNGWNLRSVEEHLREYGISIEQFNEICKKHGI